MEAFSFKPTIGLLVPSFSSSKKVFCGWKSKKVGIFACKDDDEVIEKGGMGFKGGKIFGGGTKVSLSEVAL